MRRTRRSRRSPTWPLLAALALSLASPLAAGAADWQPFVDEDVIEILTTDEDGDPRETKVWIVVLDDHGYVRTNDSRWLANIRRGSRVRLRLRDEETPVRAVESADEELSARLEAAYKEKYGFVQRVMSTFRTTEPTVLELTMEEPPR